jgi:biotin carboxyl carrier protein
VSAITLRPASGDGPIITGELATSTEADGTNAFTFLAGGQTLSGEWSFDAGTGSLRLGERVVPFYAAEVAGELQLWVDGQYYRFDLTSPTAPVVDPGDAGRESPPPAGDGQVVAPMPGQIRRILVEPGAQVSPGDPIVALESMKMELTVSAPSQGRVAEVMVRPGQVVDLGAVLVKLDPLSG